MCNCMPGFFRKHQCETDQVNLLVVFNMFNTVYHLQAAEINFVSKHLTLGWIILKCEGGSPQGKLHLYQQFRAGMHEEIYLEDLSCERILA